MKGAADAAACRLAKRHLNFLAGKECASTRTTTCMVHEGGGAKALAEAKGGAGAGVVCFGGRTKRDLQDGMGGALVIGGLDPAG